MTRVILVVPRHGVTAPGNRLASALDKLANLGYNLVGIIDPEQARDALRLVLDGEVDLVVATRPEHIPFVAVALDLDGGGERRPRPVLRPEVGPEFALGRRPQLVDRSDAARSRRSSVVRRTA